MGALRRSSAVLTAVVFPFMLVSALLHLADTIAVEYRAS
jgi:hypothetical protein